MEHHNTRALRQIAETSDRFLGWFVDAWIVFALGLWLFEYLVTPAVQYPAVIGLVVGVLTRWVFKRGHAKSASWIFLSLLCVAVSVIPALTNGVRSPVLANVPMLVLLSGWLLGHRPMLTLTAVLSAVVFGYTLLENYGLWVPPLPIRSPAVFSMVWVAITTVTAIITRAMVSSFDSNVRREVMLQSDLAESELLFRTLLTSLHDGILLVNDKGHIEYVNQELCNQFSIAEPPESLVGLTARDVVNKISTMYEDPQATITRLRQIVATGQPHLGEEITLKNGRTLLRDFIPFAYGDGRIGRVWHLRDVSALRKAQAELIDANQKLETLSITDGLTGLANRRQFDHVLLTEWARCQRQGCSLALVLLDVDWFKHYNDIYGHQTGDGCLQEVASVLRANARRAADLAARYGGEEFALIAPDADLETATALAESIRAAVRERARAHTGSPLGQVSVSLGVAAMVPSASAHPDALLLAADQALYQAKHLGRDRVQVA